METKQVFASNKERGLLLGFAVAAFLLALVVWQLQVRTASASHCNLGWSACNSSNTCSWWQFGTATTSGFCFDDTGAGVGGGGGGVPGARGCDTNAVGTNVMVGCVWKDTNANGQKDSGDILAGPARQNPVYVKTSPSNMVHYQALGWWGFSYHHFGCCQCQQSGAICPLTCNANSCDYGTNPLAVSGVPGWGERDNVPKAIGIWKGNFTFDAATYFFRLNGDFPHPRRLYIDDQLKTSTGGFIEQTLTAGTHKVTVEYSQDNDASLGFTIVKMQSTLTVIPTSITSVLAGQTKAFTASFDPDGTSTYDNPHYASKPAQDVTAAAVWTSSNPNVASVTSAGQIKGIKAGTVTITVAYSDKSDTSQLTVTGTSGGTTCSGTNCGACAQSACTALSACRWTGSACVANTGSACSSSNCNACTQATCPASGCDWNGSACVPEGGSACSSGNCGSCTTQTSCIAFGSACSWTGTACITNTTPPSACSNRTGYASNCSPNGAKILRVIQSSLSQTNLKVFVNFPPSPANVIYNTGYYWSPTRNQWISFTLTGTAYSSATTWLKDSASASLNIPLGDLQTGANYILTWDYIRSGTCWVGPAGTCGTGKWRIAVFNIQ